MCQRKTITGIVLITFFLTILISGCIEKTDSSEKNNENSSILGTWTAQEDTENSTYKVLYIFYSNSSFFTGVLNLTSQRYDIGLWGEYSYNDTRLTFVVSEDNSTSDLKYSLSDDTNTLLLYYEDEINFDILKRET